MKCPSLRNLTLSGHRLASHIAEVAILRQLFADILGLISALRLRPIQR